MKRTFSFVCLFLCCLILLSACGAPRTPNPTASLAPSVTVSSAVQVETTTAASLQNQGGTATLTALDKNGKTVWVRSFSLEELTSQAAVSPAAISGDRVYVQLSGTLYALLLTDGQTIWQAEDIGAGLCAPLVDHDGTIYVTGYEGPDLSAISSDGIVLWTASSGSGEYYWANGLSFEGDLIKVTYQSKQGQSDDALLFTKSGDLSK